MTLLLVMIAMLLFPVQASAAWGAPQVVASPPAHLAGLAAAPDGTALSWWLGDRRWQLARRPPGGGWTGPCSPVGRGRLVAPVVHGRSRVIAGSLRGRRLSVHTGTTAECRLRGPRTITRASHRIVHPTLAANRRGRVALVWWEDRGTRNDRVRVALRRPGRPFSRPRALGEGSVRHATAAVGPAGDVLVAWEQRGRVRVRSRPPGRARFGPAQTIRSAPTHGARVEAAVGPDGRAYVAWTAQRRSEGGDVGPAIVEAATRPGRRTRFGTARTLERFEGRVVEDGRLELGVDAAGGATVAWTGADGVRAATDAGGFGEVVTLATGDDVVLADLAVAPDGAAVVLWDAGAGDDAPLEAAYRAPGGDFRAPERVASAGRHARAAFTPLTGAPTALWWQPDGLRASDREPEGGIASTPWK